jgi:hypothetical protein
VLDHKCKIDLFFNNLNEVFNKMILDVTAKPIKTMMDGNRSKFMVRYMGREEVQELLGGKSHPPIQRN